MRREQRGGRKQEGVGCREAARRRREQGGGRKQEAEGRRKEEGRGRKVELSSWRSTGSRLLEPSKTRFKFRLSILVLVAWPHPVALQLASIPKHNSSWTPRAKCVVSFSPKGKSCLKNCFVELWICDGKGDGRKVQARKIHHTNSHFQTWRPPPYSRTLKCICPTGIPGELVTEQL